MLNKKNVQCESENHESIRSNDTKGSILTKNQYARRLYLGKESTTTVFKKA